MWWSGLFVYLHEGVHQFKRVRREVQGVMEGSVNVMGRKGGNRLFPTLTLTLTFHHPEQSLLHKLHWLDHVIRVGVFS